jgi:hypothetical protein
MELEDFPHKTFYKIDNQTRMKLVVGRLGKISEHICLNFRRASRDLNQLPAEYKSQVLPF